MNKSTTQFTVFAFLTFFSSVSVANYLYPQLTKKTENGSLGDSSSIISRLRTGNSNNHNNLEQELNLVYQI